MLILGGGPAGLAAGYHARKCGWDFSLLEAGGEIGGNCRTLRLGDFRFDTGAHRLHDKDPEVTGEIKQLLGEDLLEVDAPSEIFSGGKFFRFPLSPSNLARQLSGSTLLRIALENMRPKQSRQPGNFEQFAKDQYGPTLAGRFLLNYSAKLWGEEPSNLSIEVSGGRLKQLNLGSVVRDALYRGKRKSRHLDGSFLYPRYGIGMIPDRMGEFIGADCIRLNNRVTGFNTTQGRIESVVVNGNVEIAARRFVNTLPLTLTVKMLASAAPREILDAAESIKYRHLVLCVFCLDRPSFSPNASLYFPDAEFPFTRLYEPKQRSAFMAPVGQTAIVLEMPCYGEDAVWDSPDEVLQQLAWSALLQVKQMSADEVVRFEVVRIPFAYPVLEAGFEARVQALVDYLGTFENLHMTGRSSLFRYLHVHDLFRAGKELMEEIAQVT